MKEELVDRITIKVSHANAVFIERWIELHLQPKPKWLPKRIWYWLISKIVILKEAK